MERKVKQALIKQPFPIIKTFCKTCHYRKTHNRVYSWEALRRIYDRYCRDNCPYLMERQLIEWVRE